MNALCQTTLGPHFAPENSENEEENGYPFFIERSTFSYLGLDLGETVGRNIDKSLDMVQVLRQYNPVPKRHRRLRGKQLHRYRYGVGAFICIPSLHRRRVVPDNVIPDEPCGIWSNFGSIPVASLRAELNNQQVSS